MTLVSYFSFQMTAFIAFILLKIDKLEKLHPSPFFADFSLICFNYCDRKTSWGDRATSKNQRDFENAPQVPAASEATPPNQFD